MIQIDNILIAEDIIDEKFMCKLSACKGICCFEGDAGAPVTDEEIELLEQSLPHILPLLSEQSKKTLKDKGLFYLDEGIDKVISLNPDASCAFAFVADGIYYCAIEKAYRDGLINLPKPISCHLYPLRELKLNNLIAFNLHKWSICKSAYEFGCKNDIPVVVALKEALIRRLGEDFYEKLLAFVEFRQQKGKP